MGEKERAYIHVSMKRNWRMAAVSPDHTTGDDDVDDDEEQEFGSFAC